MSIKISDALKRAEGSAECKSIESGSMVWMPTWQDTGERMAPKGFVVSGYDELGVMLKGERFDYRLLWEKEGIDWFRTVNECEISYGNMRRYAVILVRWNDVDDVPVLLAPGWDWRDREGQQWLPEPYVVACTVEGGIARMNKKVSKLYITDWSQNLFITARDNEDAEKQFRDMLSNGLVPGNEAELAFVNGEFLETPRDPNHFL